MLERDALNVMNDINGKVENESSIGLMIQDIQGLLDTLQYWTVTYISRNHNILAHCFAKDALKLSNESIILEGSSLYPS